MNKGNVYFSGIYCFFAISSRIDEIIVHLVLFSCEYCQFENRFKERSTLHEKKNNLLKNPLTFIS